MVMRLLLIVILALVSATAAFSPATSYAADTTPPSAPVLSGTAGDRKVDLSWTASTDNVGVAGYDVYINGAYKASTLPSVRTYSATGLTNGTAYDFRVVALDAANNWANSNTITKTPVAATTTDTTPPSSPMLTASPGDTRVDLSWTASTDNVGIAGYDVYKNGTYIASTSPSVRTYAATGLTNGTSYTFKVVALDAANNWANSNDVISTPVASAAATWNLVWEDNFSGTGVDTTKWGMYDGPGHGGNGYRRPSAFSVANGLLTITAKNGLDGKVVSGGMARLQNQAYGRYEVRVRTDADTSQTMSGVSLTWPQSENWPYDGELDWYETGTDPDRTPFMSWLHHYRATTGGDQTGIVHNASGQDWHVMVMEWTPSRIDIYRDGTWIGALTDSTKVPAVPHHVCLQLDAFKPSLPLGATVKMQVDYVKVYSKSSY